MRKTLIAFGIASTLVAGVAGSHRMQVDSIERKADDIRANIGNVQGSTIDDLNRVLDKVNCEIGTDKNDLMFLFGDFQVTKDNQSRCGGVSKKLCYYGAEYGFDSRIGLEYSGDCRFHYYAILTRDDRSFKIVGGPPNLRFQELD